MVISGNQQFLRTLNRLAVLRAVRLNTGISRVRLADLLDLTRPTIGNIVDELITDGWISEERLGPTGALGRRPVALHLNDTNRILIGADINNERVICLATTPSGDIREMSVTPTHSGDAETVMDILARQTHSLCVRMNDEGFRISAMGIAVPGPVDADAGMLRYSDNTGWRNLRVRDMLQERLARTGTPQFPLLIQRAVGCVALFYFEHERKSEAEPLLYVHVGQAVTSAIATRYSLIQGHKGMTGAINHLIVDPDGPLCTCGKRGCANMLVTLRAVQNATGCTGSEIRAAAQSGNPILLNELRVTGHRFGIFLHNLSMQFDPARLLVGGPAFQAGPGFLEAAREAFNKLYEQAGIPAPRIEVVRHEANSVALGAATGALYSLVRPVS